MCVSVLGVVEMYTMCVYMYMKCKHKCWCIDFAEFIA